MNQNAADRTKQLFTAIGQRIRAIRQEKGLSLNELAKRTGFAKSYLSQIENLKREPSISALSQVAHILGVDVLYLLSGEMQNGGDQSLTFVKKNERKLVNRPTGSIAYAYESLTYKKKDRVMEAYIVTIGSEYPPEPFVHAGQEITYVLDGSHEFTYDGKTYNFEEGDCYYFDSNKPHYSRSLDNRPGRLLVVFTGEKE
jgi:transcriptional regulator with XRE-family HTH domain